MTFVLFDTHALRRSLQVCGGLLVACFLASEFGTLAAKEIERTAAGPWQPDNQDGTYQNPVLYADYSDPDIVGVDGDYYMTASSFNCVPGLPILHSRDLVNWEIINHALPRLYDEDFAIPQHGNGVWAPSFRYHDGWYYIYWGDADRGIYMIRTQDPAAEWTKPVLVKKAYGNIDPCPLWDDDGKVYMVHAFAHSRAGVKSLLQVVELSPDGSQAIDKGWIVFDGHQDHPTIEGPKFYKRNGYYYIFAPAGGVPTGWQLVLRSKNIRGPYEARNVLAQGPTNVNGPHQGGWVETPAGECWFMHFQDAEAYGRIVHLEPMKWVDDWPQMGEDPDGDSIGQPVLKHRKPKVDSEVEIAVPDTSDEFGEQPLSLQWQWHATPETEWSSLAQRAGWLHLAAVPRPSNYRNLWDAPNLLLQKLPAPEFEVTCRLDADNLQVGDRAGLVMMGQDYAYVAIERTASGLQVVRRTCPKAEAGTDEQTEATAEVTGSVVELRVEVTPPAKCSFSYRTPEGQWKPLGVVFSAREGKWIGAKVGLFCLAGTDQANSGSVDVDWFRVE